LLPIAFLARGDAGSVFLPLLNLEVCCTPAFLVGPDLTAKTASPRRAIFELKGPFRPTFGSPAFCRFFRPPIFRFAADVLGTRIVGAFLDALDPTAKAVRFPRYHLVAPFGVMASRVIVKCVAWFLRVNSVASGFIDVLWDDAGKA
jgi:hypothetical protein